VGQEKLFFFPNDGGKCEVCYLAFLTFNVKYLSPAALYLDTRHPLLFITVPLPARDLLFMIWLTSQLIEGKSRKCL